MFFRKFSLTFFAFALYSSVGYADTTLVYGVADGNGNAESPSHQIHVKDGKVSVANAGDKRVLVFDSSQDSAIVVDHAEKKVTELNRDSVERLAAAMYETQRQYLAGLEEKLRDAPNAEQEKLRGMMDLLHEATEPGSGPARQSLQFRDTGHGGKQLGVSGTVADVFKGEAEWGAALLAEPSKLGIKDQDLAPLGEFQNFFDTLTKGLPGKLRAQFGEVLILTSDERVIMDIEQMAAPEDGQEGAAFRMSLLHFDHGEVEDGWFEAPADFQRLSLFPVPKTGENGVPQAEDTSGK